MSFGWCGALFSYSQPHYSYDYYSSLPSLHALLRLVPHAACAGSILLTTVASVDQYKSLVLLICDPQNCSVPYHLGVLKPLNSVPSCSDQVWLFSL